ncbi:RagB/SusD family nutrient uptake outer membrane protein [Sphingobacterium sp. DK4209]|uniref:RagB/SusD family nutrient uptake outer membrane protein n=1 Tax=Sphingobacterium zhuxiongii TaxID=2662364 RepID=A0A5Q0QGL6_9SPHI|nr:MULTISPECIES: RagB/SusD family nutrient uptake outer membrane protein [unclassified Sphingobacterium]MVZ65322.1 RagB/SusD family nutrient uptake outer membrane protein [Sphingobacterium sp. DK4209]QGA26410.1 RagB/SusD family nutrient uptake outer membrane protein [Sphingobacterium sp. dk4302]
MKKRILYIGLIVAAVFQSCSLEVEPLDRYSEEVAWRNEKNMDMYVKGFYAGLRDKADVYTNTFSDGLSDLFKYSVNNLNAVTYHNKTLLQENYITANNGVLSEWGNYDRIKSLNEFLLNIDDKGADIDEQSRAIRKAEVRFLRAFLYYRMIRNHGGVILRLERSGDDGGLDNEKDINKKRESEADSWAFVIKELQEAAAALKGHVWTAADYGRITEGAAQALLSRVALYAKQYPVVIQAGKRVEELGYVLDNSYEQVFKNAQSKEIILPVMFEAPEYVHYADRYFAPTGDVPNRGGWGGPTEELVSLYQIKEGDKFVDFNWNNANHKEAPYANREARFYASILYHGANWNNRQIQVNAGGKDAFTAYDQNSNTIGNVTGYFMRKFLTEGNPDVDLGSTSYWVELRMGEVLLNMSEAYAQTNDFTNAYAYLNKIRTRAAVSPRASGSTLAVFMDYLGKERMVELAFEGHRYWDLKRWKKAIEVIDGKRATGVQVSGSAGAFTFNRVQIESIDRYFPEKYYLIPIPQSELANNSEALQNDKW